MKITTSVLVLIFSIAFSSKSFSQIDVNITDIDNNKTIPFSKIYETYDLDKSLPTLVITWSAEWCYPCIRLINRYNDCDLSMLNVITINIDAENYLEDALNEGHQKNWDNMLNFHANIGEDEKGFDKVFNVTSAPLILILDNGDISDATVSYSLYPYKLLEAGRIRDVNFIWDSSQDLNSLAWSFYNSENDPGRLAEALKWIDRSIELDQEYSNTDTYAALLFKTGEYTKALKAAKDAIEIAKNTNEDYESTTDLINKIIEKL
ncbi:tetratricopeptide repeat protein [Algoriphagus aquimarinus]|nr:tetratricopeptide repeat protein [Algoriphagus aquimarinus]